MVRLSIFLCFGALLGCESTDSDTDVSVPRPTVPNHFELNGISTAIAKPIVAPTKDADSIYESVSFFIQNTALMKCVDSFFICWSLYPMELRKVVSSMTLTAFPDA